MRAINDAIKEQKYDDAIEKVQTLLEKDPKNYQW